MSGKSSSDTEQEEGLTQGDNSGFMNCTACGSLTDNSPMHVRFNTRANRKEAVQITLCDACDTGLERQMLTRERSQDTDTGQGGTPDAE